MRVVGGHFGAGGTAKINKGLGLVVSSGTVSVIPFDHISSVLTTREQGKEFSAIYFLVGGALFGAIGWFLTGVLGSLVGLVIAVATSFSTKTTLRATVKTTDDRLLELEGWYYEIQKVAEITIKKN